MSSKQFSAKVPTVTIAAVRDVSTLAHRVRLRLEWLKERRGYSQNKVNSLAGFSDGYLARVKSGAQTNLGIDYLERLAAALEVPFEWLSRGAGTMELPADPKTWSTFPEFARVALRVVVGRGVDPKVALKRVEMARLPSDAGTVAYLRIASGDAPVEPPKPVEFPRIVSDALGLLVVRDPHKAKEYVEAARGIETLLRTNEANVEKVARQIESLVGDSSVKRETADGATRVKPKPIKR